MLRCLFCLCWFWWCSFLKKLLLENWIELSKWDGWRSFFWGVCSLVDWSEMRKRERNDKDWKPKSWRLFWWMKFLYCEGKKTNEWINGGWLMMKMSLLNLIRGVLKLVVWNWRIIWAWLCYLLLLVLVDERWLSCFDLVNLKAHTRSLVNERYISVKGLRWWDVVAIFVVLSLRWVSEMLQSCGEHHVFFLVIDGFFIIYWFWFFLFKLIIKCLRPTINGN